MMPKSPKSCDCRPKDPLCLHPRSILVHRRFTFLSSVWFKVIVVATVVVWLLLCATQFYDSLTENTLPSAKFKPSSNSLVSINQSQTGVNFYANGIQAIRQREKLLGPRSQVFDNGYSSQLIDLIYRTVMHSSNDPARQQEFERRVEEARLAIEVSAALARAELSEPFHVITASNMGPINMHGHIDADDLVAADDYNFEHFDKGSNHIQERELIVSGASTDPPSLRATVSTACAFIYGEEAPFLLLGEYGPPYVLE